MKNLVGLRVSADTADPLLTRSCALRVVGVVLLALGRLPRRRRHATTARALLPAQRAPHLPRSPRLRPSRERV